MVIFQQYVSPLCTWSVHNCKLQTMRQAIHSSVESCYRMSLRPSVLEQLTLDRSGVDPFFSPVNFPGSNVKPVVNNGANDHMPTVARRSQWVLILIRYISRLRLSHVKICQRYIQYYAHSKRSRMLHTHARTQITIVIYNRIYNDSFTFLISI